MKQIIIPQLVARAAEDIKKRASATKTLTGSDLRLQTAFNENKHLKGNHSLAALCGLITGFTPETGLTPKVVPFQVFAVGATMCLCVFINKDGLPYGIVAGCDQAYYWDGNSRLATDEEAARFINDTVSRWTDSKFLSTVACKLGEPAVAQMLSNLGLN